MHGNVKNALRMTVDSGGGGSLPYKTGEGGFSKSDTLVAVQFHYIQFSEERKSFYRRKRKRKSEREKERERESVTKGNVQGMDKGEGHSFFSVFVIEG